MVALIILVICLTFLSAFWAEKKLDASFLFLDFDVIYLHFLEEEENKKQIEINIKDMIKIEQKIKNNNKIIKLYKNNKKPVYITGCGYIMSYKDKPSSFDVWKAEGLNIKLSEQWQKKYNLNKMLGGIKK